MMTKVSFSVLAALSIMFAMGCGGGLPDPKAGLPDPTKAATTSATPGGGDKDTDGDGIPDSQDKCPDKKEDGQPPDPKDGCPKA
jgi:hypothetical protein